MFTNLLLGASLLLSASLVPPDVNKVDVIGQRAVLCPETNTPIEITMYKAAGDQEDTIVVVVWARNGVPVAALDVAEQKVYIYKEQKEYTLDEVRAKYPTPCDIPHSDA